MDSSVPMKFNSLDEMEKIVIKTFINDQGIFSRCEPEIKESFFEKDFFRRVFRILRKHYRKYSSIPDLDLMKQKLEEELGSGTNDDLKEKLELYLRMAETIYSEVIPDIDAYKDVTEDFIYKKKCKDAIQAMTEILTKSTAEVPNSELFAIDKFVNEIKNGNSVIENKREPFNLADFSSISDIRKDALGSDEDGEQRVVKLFVERMNNIMQYNGIPLKNLILVSASPGSGKSTFLINQGLFCAKNDLKVCHMFLGDMTRFDGFVRYYSCYYDSMTNERLERKFRLEEQMKQLNQMIADLTGELNRGTISDENKEYLENLQKNKTMFEKQIEELGKPTLDSKAIVGLNETELIELIKNTTFSSNNCFKNIDIYEYAVGELTIDQLREEVIMFQKMKKVHYDVIIIDYDGNLRATADSMYESGGEIYNKAKNLAETNKSVVFIASQPKREFWDKELIPLEAAAESSKKQQVIDMMITLGRPKGNTSGIRFLYVPKNRRGEENKNFKIKMNGNSAFMYQISDEEYNEFKKQGMSSDYVEHQETFIEKQLREKEEKAKEIEETLKAQEEIRNSLNENELPSVQDAMNLFEGFGYDTTGNGDSKK